jgi:hypothetical protein
MNELIKYKFDISLGLNDYTGLKTCEILDIWQSFVTFRKVPILETDFLEYACSISDFVHGICHFYILNK